MPAPEPGERWGILGGAFDPVHNGHLALAQNIKQLRRLDGILLVPTVDPPHRTQSPVAPYRDRFTMTQLAAAKLMGLEVSGIEETTGRPSYTLETVRHFHRQFPQIQLYWLIGADSLSELVGWYHIEQLADECQIVTAARPGYNPRELQTLKSILSESQIQRLRQNILETPQVDISATRIRRRIQNNQSISYLTPSAVIDYIKHRNLYTE